MKRHNSERPSRIVWVWTVIALLLVSNIPVHACLDPATCSCCRAIEKPVSSCCHDGSADSRQEQKNDDTCCIDLLVDTGPVIMAASISPVAPLTLAALLTPDVAYAPDVPGIATSIMAHAPPVAPPIRLAICSLLL